MPRPSFVLSSLLQLDLGVTEQQGGGAESGLQRGPACGREQHRAGVDQGDPGRGQENDWK